MIDITTGVCRSNGCIVPPKVRDVRMISDRNSRKSKGIAYIEFVETNSVPLAIGLTGQRLLGVPIIVQASQVKTHTQRKKPIACFTAATCLRWVECKGQISGMYLFAINTKSEFCVCVCVHAGGKEPCSRSGGRSQQPAEGIIGTDEAVRRLSALQHH